MDKRRSCGSRSWVWVLSIVFCACIVGCGDNGGGVTGPAEEGVGTAAIALKMSATTAAELSRVEVVITGADMDLIRENLEWDGNTATGTVIVPAGEGRLFTLNAYDLAGDLRYTGEDRADVVADREITVEITMRKVSSSSPSQPGELSGEIAGLTTIQIGYFSSSNWDGDIEDDGLQGGISFMDSHEERIRWRDAVVSLNLKIFIAQGAFSETKKYPSSVFEGDYTLSSYEDERLIRVPYEEMLPNIPVEDIVENSLSPGSYYIRGVVEMTVILADGSTYATREATMISVDIEALQRFGLR